MSDQDAETAGAPPAPPAAANKALKLSELTSPPGLFRSRLTGATVRYGDATIKLMALTTRQLTYVLAQRQADAHPLADALLYVAWSLDSVSGLTDETGAEVQPERDTLKLLGAEQHPVSLAWLDRLDATLVLELAQIVQRITNLQDSEQLRVDFT